MMKHEDVTLLLRQIVEHLHHFATVQVLVGGRSPAREHEVRVVLRVSLPEEAALANARDGEARHDAIHPRFEPALAAVTSKIFEHGDERVLCNVVHVFVASHQIPHEVTDARQDLREKIARGVLVALDG
jgi:hypothetical protein